FNRNTVIKFYQIRITYPIRTRDNDLVTFIDDDCGKICKRLFGTSRNDNLVPIIGQAIVTLKLFDDGIFKFYVAIHRRVRAVIVINGLYGSLFYIVWRIEIWFA